MRKDFISAIETLGQDETSFVEAHWTKIWDREGSERIDRVSRQEEFKMMAPYLQKLPKNSAILDGGCGLGDWVLYLKGMGFNTTGLDISKKVIAQLQDRFPHANFRSGDIRRTEFTGDSFDLYFSWGVFEHFENGPQDCLREAARLLRPGGLLFITVPHDNLRHSFLSAFRPFIKNSQPIRFYQYRFTRSELMAELIAGEFDIEIIKPIHKRQGVLRFLHHSFGLPYDWLISRALAAVISILIPGLVISHMLFAVARKPSQTS